ncbi:TetR/AcrR family transcriptional regulator [Conexibacter sp. SYSU D00693]|uniref:TetR/AcrR family transcriptional regulator n=1 Tax=Conexibacter sp. SYSU D00693 TaxID=2812560 RepID=UPI00196A2593|nr:TetR/AcrR family transcriptional regulator [Conexibacter sp. SYSU D00693]
MARRRLTAAERRQEILRAALDVFAASGYHGASIDEVARTAGVSKALVFQHFASKRELHDTLLDEHATELFRRFRANAEKGTTGEERLRGGVDAFFSFVEEHADAWRALFRDQADPELRPVIDRLQEQAVNVMDALALQDPGTPRRRPDESEEEYLVALEMLSRLLSGSVQGLANWWLEHPEVPRSALVDRVVDFCWVGLERLRDGERATPGGVRGDA